MYKGIKKKYEVVRGAISYELANFILNYFLMQRDATAHLMDQKIIKDVAFGSLYGTWKDSQAPNTFSKYGDWGIETLLMKLLPLMSKITGLPLIPSYGYGRIYKKGDELVRHKDRISCEISYTLHLGGDPWEIFIDPSGKSSVKKVINDNKVILKKNPQKGFPILLKPGDMMVYRGEEIEHWRKPFKGNIHAQAFGHYNNEQGPYGRDNLFDGRPLMGIPDIIL
jgi:hypothetical protein